MTIGVFMLTVCSGFGFGRRGGDGGCCGGWNVQAPDHPRNYKIAWLDEWCGDYR